MAHLIDKAVPNKDKAHELKKALEMEAMRQQTVFLKAARDVVVSEATSEHKLAAIWRPVTMLVFVTLVVATWFGWTDSAISESMTHKLMDIIEVGLGGYVIGRSVEKVARSGVLDLIKSRKDT